jgi:hypothetical protein
MAIVLSPLGASASEVTGTLSTGGASTVENQEASNPSGNVTTQGNASASGESRMLSGRVASGNEARDVSGSVLGASDTALNPDGTFAQASVPANATPVEGQAGAIDASRNGRAVTFGIAFAGLLILSYIIYARYVARPRGTLT